MISSAKKRLLFFRTPEAGSDRRSLYLAATGAVLTGLLCAALYFRFSPPPIPEIGPVAQTGAPTLASSWATGEVIMLVRHMERCDRSAAACLDAPDGITLRGSHLATALGEAVERLGVGSADVITSPATRTKQTARHMFTTAASAQEWLSDCKAITIGEISRHKAEGRNLILVTHNHCIEKIERDLRVSAARDPAYGSLLLIAWDEKKKTPVAAGFVYAEQFIAALSPAGPSN